MARSKDLQEEGQEPASHQTTALDAKRRDCQRVSATSAIFQPRLRPSSKSNNILPQELVKLSVQMGQEPSSRLTAVQRSHQQHIRERQRQDLAFRQEELKLLQMLER